MEPGETFYSIAKKYGVTVEALQAANPSVLRDKMPTGVVLMIPLKHEAAPLPSKQAQKVGAKPVAGLKTYTVPAGETMYNLGRVTGWTREQLLQYNPHLSEGVRTGMVILIPDKSIENNRALAPVPKSILGSMPSFSGVPFQTVVLALPFKGDGAKRFVDYYEGFLLAVKELKDVGAGIDLHVFDCTDAQLTTTLSQIRDIKQVDLIIGGVSDDAVQSLGNVAKEVGARYVIPFTSKNYYLRRAAGEKEVFQINTPHEDVYKMAARKFVGIFGRKAVYLAKTFEPTSKKDEFIVILKDYLERNGIRFKEISLDGTTDRAQIVAIAKAGKQAVIIPNSGAYGVANRLMADVQAVTDSLGVHNISLFGYPEWQAYANRLGSKMYMTNATFYTTFYTSPSEPVYQSFQKEYVSWFSHSVGSSYPKYSILGYDTGKYFLFRRSSELVGKEVASQQYRGVQSYFHFAPSLVSPGVYLNNGVIFVTYSRDRKILKQ